MGDDARRRWPGGETALGGLLLLLGILVLLGQALDLELGRVGWPFFVIVPGLGVLGLGLATPGRLGEVLATVGGVVTMAGLVLGVQNATDRFETWAYAWTLVLLVGAGLGAGWWGWCAAAVSWPPAAPGWSRPGWSASWSWRCSSRSWSGSAASGVGRPAATSWRPC
jgi:hypothetical protein